MIKESKLIGTKLSMPYGWHEFSPLDLFDFPMAKSLNKDDLIPKLGGSPYVTRTVDNNGVNMLIDLSMIPDEYVNAGNEFSFGLLGLKAFYQKHPYVAGQFVRRFVPKFDMNETLALYFKTLIDKLKSELQTTSIKGYANILQKPLWMLPVTQDGQPDYDWMSSYIRELENQHIRELENQRIRELETYLQVTGLDDTILTDNELQVLEQWRQHEKFGGGRY